MAKRVLSKDQPLAIKEWDQSLVMEEPFSRVRDVIEKIFGLSQHVDRLERMNREVSKLASDFRDQETAPPEDEEGAILVQTADGKGVPIRRQADASRIESHQKSKGPSPAPIHYH